MNEQPAACELFHQRGEIIVPINDACLCLCVIAKTDEQELRPQHTKLLHNVADNCHDNMAQKEKQDRMAETMQCHRNLSNEAVFFPLRMWAISVFDTCLMRNNCNK